MSCWWLPLVVALVPADASRPNPAFAALSTADVDQDYWRQGEYIGQVSSGGRLTSLGLQVVARGQGKFVGLAWRGGLPGNGAETQPLAEIKGWLEANALRLQAGEFEFHESGINQLQQLNGPGQLQRVVRKSATLGAPPPPGALVLFDGHDVQAWKNAKITDQKLLQVGPETQATWRDFYLHGEFKTPYMPHATGQKRGNSGFYLQKRYEIQVLDSFGLKLQFNDCASVYRIQPPLLNLSFPPLEWQTYDIDFRAARFEAAGQKIAPARITLWHNGVVVHGGFELPSKTGAGSQEGPLDLPILLQNHNDPVEYRNLWIIDRSPERHAPTTSPAVAAPSDCKQ